MTEETLNGYCMKCKASRPMKDAVAVYMANGRPATRGTCSVCGTGLFKIGMTAAHASVPKPEPVPATGKRTLDSGAARAHRGKAVVKRSNAGTPPFRVGTLDNREPGHCGIPGEGTHRGKVPGAWL